MSQVSGSDLTYQDVTVNLRPSRVALLVCSDENWAHDSLRAIEMLSRTWGGEGGALVAATSDWRVSDAIWEVLAEYDADYWAFLSRNLRWLHLADESAVDPYLREIVSATLPDGHDAEEWLHVVAESDLPVASWSTNAPSDELKDRITSRTSPYGGTRLLAVPFRADEDAPHPLVDLSVVGQPEGRRITVVSTRDVPREVDLLVQSRLGSLSPSWRAELLGSGVTIREVFADSRQIEALFELGWGGHHTIQPVEIQIHVGEQTVIGHNESVALSSIQQESPFSWGSIGVGWYEKAPVHPRLPFVIYCGTTAEDFSRAQIARAMDYRCLWLPLNSSTDEPTVDAALRALHRKLRSLGPHLTLGADCYFTSTSLSTREIEGFRERFFSTDSHSYDEDASGSTWRFEVRPIEEVRVSRRLMLLDGDRSLITSREPFIGEAMARTLEVQVPSQVVGITPDRCRWHLDVHTEGHAVPQRSCLDALLFADEHSFAPPVRASNHCLTVGSHSTGFVLAGMPQRLLLSRVRPRYPSAEEIFRTLLRQSGGELQPSDKGNFSRHMIERWGDLQTFAKDARDDATGRALSVWRDKRKLARLPGKVAAGRRRMRLVDVETATGMDHDSARHLVDRWSRSGILVRGLVLRCPRCRNTDFHLLEEVGQRFVCARCGSGARIEEGDWTGRDETEFWYSMDELIVLALSLNCHVPLLVLSDLAREDKSFAFAFESDVELDGSGSEVDLLAIRDGRIVVGEVTTADDLGTTEGVTRRRLERLKRIAEALTADSLVLATTAPAWSNRMDRLRGSILTAVRNLEIRVGVQELQAL